MFFSLLASLRSFLLDLIIIRCQTAQAKDRELLLLRQHVRILQRKQPSRLRIATWEKLAFAVMGAKFGTALPVPAPAWNTCSSCSSPTPCSRDTANWSDAHGPASADVLAAAPPSQRIWRPWCSA